MDLKQMDLTAIVNGDVAYANRRINPTRPCNTKKEEVCLLCRTSPQIL